jgi:fatty-acyl-CoA synthase
MRRAAALFGGVAIVSRDAEGRLHRYDYGAMMRRARQCAVALAQLGIGRGDRVATLGWNTHQHLEAYFAIPAIGAVLHTLNPRLHASELSYVIEHAGDRAIVVDRDLLPVLTQLALPRTVEHVVVMGGGAERPAAALDYDELVATGDADAFAEVGLDERDAAAMCYTSGTTGRPKGVVYSHRALALHALNLTTADSLGVRVRDVILAVVPMFHINGWGLPFAAALAGAKLVLPGPRLDPASLVGLIASERVTLSGGVPTIWMSVLHALDAGAVVGDVRSLRMLAVGGSAVPEAMLRGYKERYGIDVTQAWGMTETASIATVCTLPGSLDGASTDAQYAWLTKQGAPLPFVEIRARGEHGLVPWDGQTMGELEIRGPMIARQYYDAHAPVDCLTPDGWFRTGDIVTIASGGCVELRDRAKDLIKSGGEWISSVALENALMGHPSVAEAAVVAIPDPRWDERPLAVIVVKPGRQVDGAALGVHLAPCFPKWWIPDRYEFVEEIPRTSTGKFLKRALRERFRDAYEIRR